MDFCGVALHWSATLVALVTLNCLLVEALAEPEFMPELLPAALLPGAVALAVVSPLGEVLALAIDPLLVAVVLCWPLSWTSFPTSVLIASRLPVSL